MNNSSHPHTQGLIFQNPVFRYLAPFVLFMILTEGQRFCSAETIFLLYAVKIIITGVFFIFLFRNHREEIQGTFDWRAIGLGFLVLCLWIYATALIPTEKKISFNPLMIEPLGLRVVAISFRILGATLLVPVMEELLWRSFLMRYLIKKDFLSLPLGGYHIFSFWVTVIAFTLVHQTWEWPAAFLTGIAYGFYLVKTKNLMGCIWAHATTNLGLAIYVLWTQRWYYW